MLELKKKDLIAYRGLHPNDMNFIYSTWLKGLRYGNDWFSFITKEAYFTFYHRIIELILNKPHVIIQIACLKEDPDVILGYSVYEGFVLHWVFVKSAWRKIGIAKDLVPEFKSVSHITAIAKSILITKFPQVEFNPFVT
jgi:hypothetical protein